jgi:hypothetical protein
MLSSVGARSSHPNLPLIPVGGFPVLPPRMGCSAPEYDEARCVISISRDGSEGVPTDTIWAQGLFGVVT